MHSPIQHRPRSSNRRWIVAVFGGVGLLALLAMLLPALFMGWVRHHLQDASFRQRIETLSGRQLGAKVRLAPLQWSDDEVGSARVDVSLANGSRAEAHGLHLGIDWSAFRRGVWHIINAGVDQLDLELASTAPQQPTDSNAEVDAHPLPGWLQAWLPDRTQLDGVRIQRFGLGHPDGWRLTGASLSIKPWHQGETSLYASLESGTLATPLRPTPDNPPLHFDLRRSSLRLSADGCHLQEALLQRGDAEVQVRGHLQSTGPAGQADLEFSRLPLADFVTANWRQRLTGDLAGNLSLGSHAGAQLQGAGQLQVHNGVLTALPVLDRLAAWSGVERFKRLVLDRAETQVVIRDGEQVFDSIVLATHGLLHLQGRLIVRGDQLDGQFWLGLTPETLRWLPGASQHVFTETAPEGPPGLRWTRVQLTGTRQAPREDLSQRLIEGVGKAVLALPAEIAAQGGAMLLEPLSGTEPAQPDKLLQNALETGNSTLESGVRFIENLGGLLGK